MNRIALVRSPLYKWLLLLLLFATATLNYADRTALVSLFPLLQKDLGISEFGLGLLGTAFLWSYALLSPVAGYIGDRVSRRSLVVLSLATWSVITAMTALASNLTTLVIMRILLGVSECFYIPAAIALLGEHHSGRTRGTALAVHVVALNAGTVLGGTAAGFMGDAWGWRWPMVCLGAAGMVLALLCHLLLVDRSSVDAGQRTTPADDRPLGLWQSLLGVMRVPTYLILVGEAMLVSVGTWIFINWLPMFFREEFKLTLGGSGFFGTSFTTAGVLLGAVGGGYLSDLVARKGARRRMILHTWCYVAAVPWLFTFLGSARFGEVAATMFAFAFFRALGEANAKPLMLEVLGPRFWSTGVGLSNMTNSIAGGAGVLLSGGLKQSVGLKAIFAGISMTVVLAAGLLILGWLRYLDRDLERGTKLASKAS
jgi:predicted MFS family arabinose efflux permease